MTKLVLLGIFASACVTTSELPIEPGEASVNMPYGDWLQGNLQNVWLSWPNAKVCHFEDWGCIDNSAATMTVVSAECRGCRFASDPAGKTGWRNVNADAVGTADGEIAISATLRFDATGETRHVVGSAMGDHGVALEATCYAVDTETLNMHIATWDELDPGELRDCTTARSSTDTIIVVSEMRTLYSTGYPVCRDCNIKAILTPEEAGWGELPGTHWFFAKFPSLRTARTVTISAPQPAGEPLTTSLEIPPAQ